MDRIHLVLSAVGGETWEKKVTSVVLPGESGSLGVLADHAPMLCALAEGIVTCRTEEGGRQRIQIGGGIASVADNELTLLLRSFEVIE